MSACRSILIVGLCCGLGGCKETPGSVRPAESSGQPTVFVVNYPLKYFAERIGGGLVDVRFPCPRDVDPAFWSPDDATIEAYQGADLILLNGAGYAKWVEHATLPPSRFVDTSAGFRDRLIESEHRVTHGHGPQGEHSHAGTAFTTWLDPLLAIEQARAIRDAFAARWPDHQETFDSGFDALESDLRELDDEIARIVSGRAVLFSHPVYQYLVRHYSLDAVSVHWEPDETPDESRWKALEDILADHPARFMIWEGDPTDASARRLKAMGVGSIVFEPCANVPPDGDYLGVMRSSAQRLALALGGG